MTVSCEYFTRTHFQSIFVDANPLSISCRDIVFGQYVDDDISYYKNIGNFSSPEFALAYLSSPQFDLAISDDIDLTYEELMVRIAHLNSLSCMAATYGFFTTAVCC